MPGNLNFCFANIKSPTSPEPPARHRTAAAADDYPYAVDSSPDLSAAFASRRFFFSSPGRSNSIVDSTSSFASTSSSSSSSTVTSQKSAVKAVPTYSDDPYADFRRSMEEMIAAHELHDVRDSWDHLHELLTCYLSLNPKDTHKFIVGAFADVVVGLMVEKGRLRRRRRKAV